MGNRLVVCLLLLLGANALCLALSSVAFAYEPDVTQQRDETIAGTSDRLIPDGSGSVRGRCTRCLAEFGRYPSSEPALEWQLQLEDGKYVLSSWRLVNPKSDVDARQVDVLRFEVSKPFAEVVYDVWANNILEARYTRHAPSADDVSYRFRTNLKGVGWPSARTGSANKDLPPKWLVDIGEEILALARAQSPKEAPVLTKLRAVRKRLNEYYHPPPPRN